MAGVKVKPAAAYVNEAEPVVLIDPTTGAPYAATGGGGGGGAVTIADGANVAQGSTTDPAYSGSGPGTIVSLLKWIGSLLSTPATQLPKTPLLNPSDLTHGFNTSSASGEVSLVAAVASQTTRVYRMTITAAAATVVEIRNGASGAALKTITFPTAGAFVYDLDERSYATTSANTALIRNSTVATTVTVDFDYVTSV